MSSTLMLDLFRPSILDPVEEHEEVRVERVSAPRPSDAVVSSGPTLDDLLVGVWEDLTAHRTDDGAGHVDELVDYRVGPRRLRIVNGDLSLDDTERGRVQKGDKIKLTADGNLSVNGTERAAQ